MTDAPPPVPPRHGRWGLVVPGLGHLLSGSPLPGVGLLGLSSLIVWCAWAGLPRLGEVTGLTGHHLDLHGGIAVLTWLALVVGCWRAAWRLAYPPPPPEDLPSPWPTFLNAFRRSPNGMLGLLGVGWIVALTLLTPLIAPFDPDAVGVALRLTPPNRTHLMGTDPFGRDMFSRVLFGARVSMAIGCVAVGLAATLGTTLGAIAGYYGGVTDRLTMWVVDLLLSVPRLVLLLAIVGLFRPQGTSAIAMIITVLGLTGWMAVSRLVRSQVLSLKEQEFIQAARALGLPDRRIILRHLIPNALGPVIVFCSLAVGATMLTEAGLSFLGLGVQPPTATWGTLVASGRDHIHGAPWVAAFPGLAILSTVMSFNLLGDGLRDALDPHQRR